MYLGTPGILSQMCVGRTLVRFPDPLATGSHFQVSWGTWPLCTLAPAHQKMEIHFISYLGISLQDCQGGFWAGFCASGKLGVNVNINVPFQFVVCSV